MRRIETGSGVSGTRRVPMECGLLFGLLICGLAVWAAPSFGKTPSSLGAEIYVRAHCSACHGGLGYGGAGPRLRGDKLLSADTYVVGQILLGRGIMPSFSETLSDSEIAAVASYIRTSWGNDYGPVSPNRVTEIRKSLTEQGQPARSPP